MICLVITETRFNTTYVPRTGKTGHEKSVNLLFDIRESSCCLFGDHKRRFYTTYITITRKTVMKSRLAYSLTFGSRRSGRTICLKVRISSRFPHSRSVLYLSASIIKKCFNVSNVSDDFSPHDHDFLKPYRRLVWFPHVCCFLRSCIRSLVTTPPGSLSPSHGKPEESLIKPHTTGIMYIPEEILIKPLKKAY